MKMNVVFIKFWEVMKVDIFNFVIICFRSNFFDVFLSLWYFFLNDFYSRILLLRSGLDFWK